MVALLRGRVARRTQPRSGRSLSRRGGSVKGQPGRAQGGSWRLRGTKRAVRGRRARQHPAIPGIRAPLRVRRAQHPAIPGIRAPLRVRRAQHRANAGMGPPAAGPGHALSTTGERQRRRRPHTALGRAIEFSEGRCRHSVRSGPRDFTLRAGSGPGSPEGCGLVDPGPRDGGRRTAHRLAPVSGGTFTSAGGPGSTGSTAPTGPRMDGPHLPVFFLPTAAKRGG